MRGRTSFVIADRLSTIRRADQILVLIDGEIVERARHEELLAQQGAYYDLYMSQFLSSPGGAPVDEAVSGNGHEPAAVPAAAWGGPSSASGLVRKHKTGHAACFRILRAPFFLECAMEALDRRLDEIDEVSAGVFEDNGRDWSHVRRLTAKFDATGLEAMDLGGYVFRNEGSGRDSCFKQSLLVCAGRWKVHWFQHQLDVCDSLGRAHRKPAELTHRYVRHLLEAEYGCVEVQSSVLIFNHDADELDLHRCSFYSLS
jgi:hypothetical protein